MIENKFAYFDSIADMYADGVSANAENTKVFDSDHQIEGIAGTPKIPYETICFIKKPNVTFTHGRFYGLPYPIELKQLVFKTTADKMTAFSVEGVDCLKASNTVTLEKGEKMRFTADCADGLGGDIVELALLTTIGGNTRIIKEHSFDNGTDRTSVRYKNESWGEAINVICAICAFPFDKGGADKTECNVYAYKTKKIGLPKSNKEESNVMKVAVHRRIPPHPKVGTTYFFEDYPKIGSLEEGNNTTDGLKVEVPQCTLTITQRMIEYKYDTVKKKWMTNYVRSELTDDVFEPLKEGNLYEPISPDFKIVSDYGQDYTRLWKLICVKRCKFIEKRSVEGGEFSFYLPEFSTYFHRYDIQFFGTRPSRAGYRTRGTWKSIYHQICFSVIGAGGKTMEISDGDIKSRAKHACRFRIVARARKGKYRSIHYVYAKRILGTKIGQEAKLVRA